MKQSNFHANLTSALSNAKNKTNLCAFLVGAWCKIGREELQEDQTLVIAGGFGDNEKLVLLRTGEAIDMTLAICTTVVPIRILIRTMVVPIRILIRTTVVPIRILIRTTDITNTLEQYMLSLYNYGYRLASIN